MPGMIEVARATVTIVPNMAGAQEEITTQLTGAAASAGTSAGSVGGSNFASALGRGLGVAGAAVGAATAAIAATATGLYNATAAAAIYGDEIDKTSQRLGMSTAAYQEWDYVMNIAGTSMQDCTIGMKTLTNQIDAAMNGSADAIANFEALGISIEDLNSMSREEAFGAVINGLQGMEDGLDRAALAQDLFGRSGQNLTPLFNMTAEETQGLIQQANDLGIVMSEDAVAASADFKDALTTVSATVTGLKNNMLSELMPSMTTVMNGLSKVFAGDEAGMAEVTAGVSDLATSLNTVLPRFLDLGVSIISTLIDGLMPMLPTLVESIVGGLNLVITSLLGSLPALIPVVSSGVILIASTLIQNLPLIIRSGMGLLMALVSGIAGALPELIPVVIDSVLLIASTLLEHLGEIITASMEIIVAVVQGLTDAIPDLIAYVPEIVVTITSTLLEHIPEITAAALDIMIALAVGLTSALPEVIEVIPDIIDGILEEFASLGSSLASNALEWGADMIMSLIDGIQGVLGNLGDAMNSVASTISRYIHFSKPDVGPLSDFDTYAPDMIDLFTEGLEDGERKISATFEDVLTLPDPNTMDGLITDSDIYVGGEVDNSGATFMGNVYIGQEKIDTIVLKANKTNQFRRGG